MIAWRRSAALAPSRRQFMGMVGGAGLGLAVARRSVYVAPRGLGFTYYDLLDQAGREDCDPRDSNCVTRNQQRVTAVQDLWMSEYMTHPETATATAPKISIGLDTSPAAYAAFMNNQPLTTETISTGGNTYSVQQLERRPSSSAGGGGAVARGGQLSFTTSRGGSALVVGDTWRIAIAGATPNAAVTVTGNTSPGGPVGTSVMGSTDSAGNYSKSGTFTSGDIGTWQETWAVGGVTSGSFSFTVAAAATAPGGQTIINSSGVQNAPGSNGGGGGSLLPASSESGFSFSSIPVWGWAALAVVGVSLAGGGRGR